MAWLLWKMGASVCFSSSTYFNCPCNLTQNILFSYIDISNVRNINDLKFQFLSIQSIDTISYCLLIKLGQFSVNVIKQPPKTFVGNIYDQSSLKHKECKHSEVNEHWLNLIWLCCANLENLKRIWEGYSFITWLNRSRKGMSDSETLFVLEFEDLYYFKHWPSLRLVKYWIESTYRRATLMNDIGSQPN